ncbi:MAG: tetrapyrrole methylase family protein/MazG family protein, partial [Clostridium sp.]
MRKLKRNFQGENKIKEWKLMIKVVGLGPGSIESLTIGTLEILKGVEKIYLGTEKHPTVDYLKSISIQFETYDDKYEECNNFDDVYRSIAEDL